MVCVIVFDQRLHQPRAAIAHVVGILHDHGVDIAVGHVADRLRRGIEHDDRGLVANACAA